MLITLLLLVFALCAARLAPDTWFGKAMRTLLIDAPIQALNRTTPLKMLVAIIVICALVAFAIGAPEWVAMFGFGDLSLYLDASVILLLTQVVAHLKPLSRLSARLTRTIASRLVAWWGRIRGRTRLGRSRSLAAPPSDDGEAGEPGWAYA